MLRTHDLPPVAQCNPRRSARLLCRAFFSAALVALASSPAHAALFDELVFAHDFENISGNDITALYGPNATKTASMTVSTDDPLVFSSQHLKAPAGTDTNANINTNSQLTTATSNLSFSIFYNAQGDIGNADGNARFLTTYRGTLGVLPGNLLFGTSDGPPPVPPALPSDLMLQFRMNSGSGDSGPHYSTETIPTSDDVWHQAGFVFEGGAVNSTVTLYFDGEQLGAPITLLGITEVNAQAHEWFLVDDEEFGAATREIFSNGFYDEAALWTRALSAQEMSNIHQFGLAGAAAVPEPSSFALLGLGALGCAFCAYRKRRKH